MSRIRRVRRRDVLNRHGVDRSKLKDPDRVADAIVVFLLMWNKAFYMRFGPPSQKLIVRFLNRYRSTIQELRTRSIFEFDLPTDGPLVAELFSKLLPALAPRPTSQAKQRQTPVGVAKALHLLAPQLLPLWDNRIAGAYGCSWANAREAANSYLRFICLVQQLCGQVLQDYARRYPTEEQDAAEALVTACATRYSTRCLLRLVDQYNYMRFVHRHLKSKGPN